MKACFAIKEICRAPRPPRARFPRRRIHARPSVCYALFSQTAAARTHRPVILLLGQVTVIPTRPNKSLIDRVRSGL